MNIQNEYTTPWSQPFGLKLQRSAVGGHSALERLRSRCWPFGDDDADDDDYDDDDDDDDGEDDEDDEDAGNVRGKVRCKEEVM